MQYTQNCKIQNSHLKNERNLLGIRIMLAHEIV